MPYSLKFVMACLALGAAATPVSLYVQRQQNRDAAKVMAEIATRGDPDRGKRRIRA